MSINHLEEYNRDIRDWLLKVSVVASAIPKEELVRRYCPVCNCIKSNFFANNDYMDYEQCGQCSLIYMNPAPSAKMVDRGFQGEDQLLMDYFSIIRKYKSDNLEKRIPPELDNNIKDIYAFKQCGKLLDVGCSIGDFLHKASHYYDVEGLEVNPHTAMIAEQSFKVYKQYLFQLELDKVYDVVTLNQILYGVPDPVGLLNDICRVLKDDGVLYINTPNSDSYAMELYGDKVNHIYGYTTLNLFNEKSLNVLASKTGFIVRSFRTEWLDIYIDDIRVFFDDRESFIHKRNVQVKNYVNHIKHEDSLQSAENRDLGLRGNYIVAVLQKI